MCDELRKIEQYGMEQGLEKGRTITQRQSAIRMRARGYDVVTIADLLDVPGEQVEIWLAEAPASA